jgi:hypothetical protein
MADNQSAGFKFVCWKKAGSSGLPDYEKLITAQRVIYL